MPPPRTCALHGRSAVATPGRHPRGALPNVGMLPAGREEEDGTAVYGDEFEGMKKGFYTIMAAQFFSSLADNALLIAAIALLTEMHAPQWMTPLLKLFFVLSYVLLAAFVYKLVLCHKFPLEHSPERSQSHLHCS